MQYFSDLQDHCVTIGEITCLLKTRVQLLGLVLFMPNPTSMKWAMNTPKKNMSVLFPVLSFVLLTNVSRTVSIRLTFLFLLKLLLMFKLEAM